MKAIIFDAFGTLFKVTSGGSANFIIKNIADCGITVDEKSFHQEWKSYYQTHTSREYKFMTERDIFISRIQMFYDRYHVNRNAEHDANSLLAAAFERKAYPEVKNVLHELMKSYQVFIGSNTDNDVLECVMQKNNIAVHKVYTSENLRCYKPSDQFFAQILADNHLAAQDVLFVGDSVTDDIMGPKAIGMKTAWIDRNGIGGDFGQDYAITNLDELNKNLAKTTTVK